MRRIIGIGETVFDIIFKNNLPQNAVPGGSTFNAMISLGRTAGKRLGVPVVMVTETGSDHIGDLISSYMSDNGVSIAALTRNPGTQSHISLAFLNEKNDADYEFYKDHAHASLDTAKVDKIEFRPGDLVLFGSFFAINPVIRDYTRALLQKARAAGAIIYYDINFRRNHIKDLPDVMSNIEENCRLSDFVRASSEDLQYLYGLDADAAYLQKIKALGPNFIVTRGSQESVFFRTDGQKFTFPVEKVQTKSTVGAGDNFNAGFLYGLIAADVSREDCAVPDPDKLTGCFRTAVKFASNVCQSFNNCVDSDIII